MLDAGGGAMLRYTGPCFGGSGALEDRGGRCGGGTGGAAFGSHWHLPITDGVGRLVNWGLHMPQGVFAFGGALVGFLIYVALERSGAIDGSRWSRPFVVAGLLGGLGIHRLIDRWVMRSLEARRDARGVDHFSKRPPSPHP